MYVFEHKNDKLLIETDAFTQYNLIWNKSQHLFVIAHEMNFTGGTIMQYPLKVDFQAHYLPPAYYEFLEKQQLYNPDGFPTPEWDLDTQHEASNP